jgi:aldehyde dehydrogenase (NAD+)
MPTMTEKDTIKALTTHYIDGLFVESHGRKVMDIIKPTTGKVIARVTLGDEEDTRRAIAAAKLAFVSFGRTTKEERLRYLHQLHKAVSARVDDLTAVMIEEYGGVARFARLIVESGLNAFAAAEKALQELPLKESWGKTTVTMEPVGVAGLITAWNANALFICLKLASAIAAGCTVVLKPSEMSALQTRAMVDVVNAAGLPKGVFNVVTGLGTVVGAELVRNPDVAKISFHRLGGRRSRHHARRRCDDEAGHARTRWKVPHNPARRRRARQGHPDGSYLGLLEQWSSLRRRNAASRAQKPARRGEASHTG